jgi:hypothetical protein
MARRRADFLQTARYGAWRLRREAWAIIPIGVVAAAFLGFWSYRARQEKQPPERIEAVVTGGYLVWSSKTGNRPIVRVRTSDGIVRELSGHRSDILRCKPGSPILLVRRGAMLEVAPGGCRRRVGPSSPAPARQPAG